MSLHFRACENPWSRNPDMPPFLIFYTMGALAALTFVVLLIMPFRRIRAGRAGQVTAEDFRYGESSRVPGEVSIPNRNYMNLLELPVLFYVVCLMHAVAGSVDKGALTLAWGYVGLRALHSLVHLTYNKVMHRLTVFAASNVVLAALWVRFLANLP
jgi:hypothetical protein